MKKKLTTTIISILFILTTGCQSQWQIEILNQGEPVGSIDTEIFNLYFNAVGIDSETVPMGHFLFHYGFTLIDKISVFNEDELIHSFKWDPFAEYTLVSKSGEIMVGDEKFTPTAIDITPSILASQIDLSIMDLAPTMAQVLNLPGLPDAQGQPVSDSKAKHAVMILVDGLQYKKLQTLIEQGSLPFFQNIDEINQGTTVYPSITTASTAALLTGAPAQVNGVYGYGYRTTEMQTLFDMAAEHNRSVTAVEGYSLAFNLRNAQVILSGDRDGDGHTDDNVLSNSLEVIKTAMPDLLFIHFHDVDDMGHGFGPDSLEYAAAVMRADGYLSQIFSDLPTDTFIAIFADHGMQKDPNSTGGNHGQLTQSSMIIPIMFLEK